MALLEVLVYQGGVYEAYQVGAPADGVYGDVAHWAMVLVDVDRMDEPPVETYVVDLVVDRDV